MRINVISLIAVAVCIGALLVPWLSSGHMLKMDIVYVESLSSSPVQVSGSWIAWNTSTNSVVNRMTYTGQPKPYFPQASWLFTQTPELFMLIATLLYVFATGLMIQTSFTTDSWSKAGKKLSIVASNLLLTTIFLFILPAVWTTKERALSGYSFMYLDIGFWLAIFGTGLAFASWLHPKFITISIQPNSRVTNLFRRWLPVAEWEKSAVMALVSFFAVVVFTIIYFGASLLGVLIGIAVGITVSVFAQKEFKFHPLAENHSHSPQYCPLYS